MAEEIATRAPEATATLTSATTSFVTWAIAHYGFGGAIPPEVYGFLQMIVPAGMGWVGACWARRRAERAAHPAG